MHARAPRPRWIATVAVVLLVSFAAAIALIRGPSPAGGAAYRGSTGDGASLLSRVDAKKSTRLFVSPKGSDAAPCTKKRPCASFDRAYRRAKPGQTVMVRDGTYPDQTINPDPRKQSADDVLFRPAKGAHVVIAGALVVRASHIELRRMTATRWESATADDQTFKNMDVDVIHIKGSHGVSVIGGDVGPLANNDSQVTSFEGRVPTGIVFDGVYFHDAVRTDPDAHTECLQFGSGIDVVIRRSRFERCAVHDVFIASWGTANGTAHPLRDFTIENNYFDKTLEGYYSLRLALKSGYPCEGFLIRNNAARQNMYSDCEAKDVRFIGNAQPSKSRESCKRSFGSVWDWNVYREGEPCGPNDRVDPVAFAAQSTLEAIARAERRP